MCVDLAAQVGILIQNYSYLLYNVFEHVFTLNIHAGAEQLSCRGIRTRKSP